MAEKKSEVTLADEEFYDTCSPCSVDGTRAEAVKYCPECKEYLCTTCVKYHQKMTATKKHELSDRNLTRHCSDIFESVKCVYHPERDVEMYCGTHEMVYCLKCITNDHRSCNDLGSIGHVSVSQAQWEMQMVQEEMKRFHDHLETAKEVRRKNINDIETRRHELSRTIQDAERNLIEHIGKLRTQATETLNKHCLEVHDELESDRTVLGSIAGEVENLTEQLQTAVSMGADQQFAVSKLVHRSLKEAKTLYENTVFRGTKAIYFTENAELQSHVMNSTALGHTHVIKETVRKTVRRNYKVKSKIWVQVKMVTDKSKCTISDVCQLQDGTVLLTDHGNNKLKRLDKSYEVQDHLDLDAVPTGICCTGKNEVCVKMNNNKLQFISVGATLVKEREIQIQDGSYYGMAFCGGELWVSRRNGVSVYNTSGTLIKSIEADIDGQKIFKTDTIQHMCVGSDAVIVTDNADGAVYLDKGGTVRRKLRDRRLSKSRGVCISDDGTVFISGCHSDNIIMFDRDGACLGELVAKDAALKLPISLYYDSNMNCIIVSCENTNNINVFELED